MSLLGEIPARTSGSRRPSRSRGVVLHAIDQLGRPFSVSDLVAKLRVVSPGTGRSAIYRTLQWLESHGKIRRVDTASGKNVFVRSDAQVVCLVECPTCGALRQLADEELSQHTGALAAGAGFALVKAIWVISMPCRKHERAKPM